MSFPDESQEEKELVVNTPKPSDLFPINSPRVVENSAPAEHHDSDTARLMRHNHTLGNAELPIATFRQEIIDAVGSSQATVITAETGAGKSTQVPQFLVEAGYEVIVTQPRVVAARSVAERVRDEIVNKKGSEYADLVGYRTARERGDSPDNQILFVTDGLQLVRELSGNGVGKKQVLVLDEVHEWNENMEVLVAWAKQRIHEDPNFKVVTMSATMEAEKLSHYFSNDNPVTSPIIEVPGRTFEVKKTEGGDVVDETVRLAREGKNTLVFVPGKAEMADVINRIGWAEIPGVTLLPLHGQMEKEDQRKVFQNYPGVKIIVATNVAQTSITIDDIHAVVDSGLERQNQVRNGVEGLYLNPISQADCLQRAGRAGRTGPGEYVLAQLAENTFVPLKDREPYGTPEIMRTRLDGMVLRLAKGGFDAVDMEFYHQPDHDEIIAAKTRLQKLGALAEDGSITKVGLDMERMPVESHYARMMIEARKYGPQVQTQLAALLAVQESGGICRYGTRDRLCGEQWRSLIDHNFNDSDAIKQLEVFIAATSMTSAEKRDVDIFLKAYNEANGTMRQLRGIEKLHDQDLLMPSPEQREQLVRCIIAGMVDNLYTCDQYGFSKPDDKGRDVSGRSMIRPEGMIVGTPFDLQVGSTRGLKTLKLLESVTNVPSIDMLREVAPQLFSEHRVGFVISTNDIVMEQWSGRFNGQDLGEKYTRESTPSEERRQFIINHLRYRGNPYSDIDNEVRRLQQKTTEPLLCITNADLAGMLEVALPIEVSSLDEARQYYPEISIDDLIPLEQRMAIDDEHPDEWYGLRVHYDEGVPYVDSSISDDLALLAFSDGSALPNGKGIRIGGTRGQLAQERIASIHTAREQERLRQEKIRLDQEGAEQGLPSDIRIRRRITGATRNSMGWVIGVDGSLRTADTEPIDRYGRSQLPDGTLIWDQVRPGEVVLSWEKYCVDAPHNFEIRHLPEVGLTSAQIEAVARLQDQIAEDWSRYDYRADDPRGDKSSPPVGIGWGLVPGYDMQADQTKYDGGVDIDGDNNTEEVVSGEVTLDMLRALQQKFK